MAVRGKRNEGTDEFKRIVEGRPLADPNSTRIPANVGRVSNAGSPVGPEQPRRVPRGTGTSSPLQ